jgi:hypothetical protein
MAWWWGLFRPKLVANNRSNRIKVVSDGVHTSFHVNNVIWSYQEWRWRASRSNMWYGRSVHREQVVTQRGVLFDSMSWRDYTSRQERPSAQAWSSLLFVTSLQQQNRVSGTYARTLCAWNITSSLFPLSMTARRSQDMRHSACFR